MPRRKRALASAAAVFPLTCGLAACSSATATTTYARGVVINVGDQEQDLAELGVAARATSGEIS